MKQKSTETLSKIVESLSIVGILILSLIFFAAAANNLLLQIVIILFVILFFINLYYAYKTYSVLSWKKSVRGRFYTSVAAATISLCFVIGYFVVFR